MTRLERSVSVALAGLALAVLLCRFAYPGDLYLTFFTDDFFYYAMVAKHLACCGASSFNLLQPTNGYHPLWLLTLTPLYAIFSSHVVWFFVAVVVLIWLLVVGTYLHLREAQRALGFDTRTSTWVAALASALFMLVLARTGMEIALALFFLAWFWARMASTSLENQPVTQAFLSGLVASGAILGRLDCAISVLLYLGFFASSSKPFSHKVRTLLPFFAGLSPVAVYVGVNWFQFHTLLPVSGMAKNLMPLGLPSSTTLARLLRPDFFNVLFTWPSLVIASAFAVTRLRQREPHSSTRDRVLLCVLLQPILFYLALSFSSDWPLWTWYLYVLVPIPALLGPAVLAAWRRPSTKVSRAAYGVAIVAAVGVLLGMARLNPAEGEVYDSAVHIQHFAAAHPGRYAMGDRSGTPAWLTDQPIIQMEGLMEDRAFLDRIKRRQNLLTALKELGVEYYVSAHAMPDAGCYDLREPRQAGPRSPVMQGQLCSAPVEEFGVGENVTRIFDLRANK